MKKLHERLVSRPVLQAAALADDGCVGTLARLCLGHTIKLRKTKGACRRRGSTTVDILLLHRKKAWVKPWLKRPVAAFVIPQSLAAGRQISAPAARKMPLLLLLLLVILLRLVVLFASTITNSVLLRLLLWVPVLALGDVALGRLEMGKGLAAGAAKVRPLARVRPDVLVQVTRLRRCIRAVGALVRPLASVRPDVSLQVGCS
jgi:hypothetical protein